ncbi:MULTISPECIES: type II toxin-antitoxin system HicB family antitoxin [Psychrobacter]|jgi:predicted RNase H-like HicB family nuclease|uniref:type II toxin-antitoxin system HicB family antitoxin n=1 Tax=Psychrobacter TaxID=497 RepID=UPI0004333AD4|nr:MULTISPECIES: type II toxin-antitoxin system HicB family antitoxin [Psychrobacter]MBA6245161.1 type II toxin-antitoxin system HicB family antitoxin [Psychrobacter sp. Urea-trap-18]MBA6285359.1 type II toxin-antitoxin system HicB family antitoxin [Psychrobacter sp. Urea-trap-16]MBA6318144.1 type II toxin-antitoxin system HicB family antitoxin [Psychrobacter sp. Urea-trap-20]MBA6334050.1 type II toxin-antitoxin system HicB family antitoxin [Psychrobacter sp. Urea-trap-19]OEH68796.1 MAG: hypot|tara:strand:- start:523 stop:795 length:273 start_codon:yes stop_codon:yes gene_type:complete
MQYPIAITPSNKTTAYGIFIPDIVGCYSASDERADISNNAKEAIMLHLKGLIEDGEAIPLPTDSTKHKDNLDFEGMDWAVVDIQIHELYE